MIYNLKECCSFYCLNHKKPVKMKKVSGNQMYLCRKYDEKYRNPDESKCINYIRTENAEKIIARIEQELEKEEAGEQVCLTNFRFQFSGKKSIYEVVILKHSVDSVHIGVLRCKKGDGKC